MGKRFKVVPLCNIKSHFGTIDSGVLYGIMREISPEFNVSREDFTGENRETYSKKNIFNFKRLKVSRQKVFTGMIETDGVTLCVHYRRLKKRRRRIQRRSKWRITTLSLAWRSMRMGRRRILRRRECMRTIWSLARTLGTRIS